MSSSWDRAAMAGRTAERRARRGEREGAGARARTRAEAGAEREESIERLGGRGGGGLGTRRGV